MAKPIASKEKAPGFLVFVNSYRWLTWLLATVLAIVKVTPKLPLVWTLAIYGLVFGYNLIFTFLPRQIERHLRLRPPLILLDAAFCAFLLGVYGWRSPFTLYSFSPVLLGGYLWQMKGSFIVAALMGANYLAVEPIAGYSWLELQRQNFLDSHISHVFDYFLIAVFFSYPTYLWMRLDKLNKGLEETSSELELSNKRLATQQEVNIAIQESLELSEILKKIISSLVEQLGFDRAAIGLVTEAGRLKVDWKISLPDSAFCRTLNNIEDTSFLKRLMRERRPLNEVKSEEVGFLSGLGASRLAAFPLNSQGKILGVLLVDNSTTGSEFSANDLDLLNAIAHQAAVAICNANLYRHAQEVSITRERNRIASEMHDNVMQSLYSTRLILDTCLKDAAGIPHLAKRLELVRQISADTLDELRSAIDDLYEGQIGNQRLTELVKDQAAKIQNAGDLMVNVSVIGLEPELPPATKKNVYLILQEAINNVVKHARATKAEVKVDFSTEELKVQIIDDGIGFSTLKIEAEGGTGRGLKTINSRVEKLGGKLGIESNCGSGTRILLTLPLGDRQADELAEALLPAPSNAAD